jgi:long-chain acyl-CoA synthetase
MKNFLIHHFLENSASRFPEKPAIWDQEHWTSYGEIERSSNRLAHYLLESGIERGDRIALLIENSVYYAIAYNAALKCGAIAVPLNTGSTPGHLSHFLRDSGAKAVITSRKSANPLLTVLRQGELAVDIEVITDESDDFRSAIGDSHRLTSLQEALSNQTDEPPMTGTIDVDPATIIYTSGTTSRPKGVVLSHRNLVANTHSIVSYLDLSSQDRILVVLPFTYVYGKSLLNTHFCVGGSVIIENRTMYSQSVVETLERMQPTGFAGVPATFLFLLKKSGISTANLSSLRYITQAGGPLAPFLQKEVARIFSPARLFVMYGTTEAAPRLTYLEPDKIEAKSGSVGRPIPNVDVHIEDENGSEAPRGQVGEIVARGSNIMLGYWNHPEATAKALRNGVYHTGDLGVMDEDGYIFVVGRTSDIIKAGGHRVSATEVESIILEIEGVLEVLVTGVPDETSGEAIKALIVPKESGMLSLMEVRQALKARLPSHMNPRYIEFVDALPKNGSGKVQRHQNMDRTVNSL